MDPEMARLMRELEEEREGRNNGGNNNNNNNNCSGSGQLCNIKFDVSYKNRTETLHKRFTGNNTVGELRQAIADEITGQIDSVNSYGKKTLLRLLYNGNPLDRLNDKLSTLAGIRGNEQANSMIHVAFNVIGGSYDDEKKQSNKERKRLPDFKNEKNIKPSLEPDCIYGYNEKKLRVKMPCGHVFDSLTIFKLTQMYVNNLTKSKIQCPMLKCKQTWDFNIVASAGDFSDAERRNFSNVLSKRALIHTGNYQECKGCKALVEKPKNIKMIRVRCQQASCKNRKDFCWSCGKDWIGGGFTVCGNKDCSTILINNLLQTCKTVKPAYLNGVECPELRVCPRCLSLVGWDSRCKHIRCWGCNKEFCYVCLSLKPDNGSWPCGGVSSNCGVAKRQSLK